MRRRLCAWVFSTPTAPRISNAQGTLLARTQSGFFKSRGEEGRRSGDFAAAALGDGEHRGPRRPVLSKSGQRVTGSLKVDGRPKPMKASVPSAPGCCTARNNVSPSGVKQGPHISAPIGTRKKSFAVPARAVRLQRVKPVGMAGARPVVALIGGDPQPPLIVDGGIVGTGEPAVLSMSRGSTSAPTSPIFGSPHLTRMSQAKTVGRVVAVWRHHLDDMAEGIIAARVGGSPSRLSARSALLVRMT